MDVQLSNSLHHALPLGFLGNPGRHGISHHPVEWGLKVTLNVTEKSKGIFVTFKRVKVKFICATLFSLHLT